MGKEGITITKIELDKKGKLVSDEVIKHIQNELPNAQKRKNKAEKFPALEVVQERYKKLSGKTLPSELVVGYETVK
ncbi:MAG: hypothetical protein LBP53_00740 [Candidatus Peribacteria bacterium]|nr:hypothetical protein [Candidatus Peribacteria bacterium]